MAINLFTLTSVIRELEPLASPEEVINRIKTIDLGLSAEDEIQAILTWLGHCRICHKIENIGFQSRDFPKLIIPDLIAVFEHNGLKLSTAIEVKSNSNSKLDWKPEYYNGLLAYQDSVGLPVLIAWKHSDYGIWTLNSLATFKKSYVNYHLSFEDSFKENLLSCIAGDRAYQLCDGVGLHIESKKQGVIERKTDSEEEIWNIIITDAWFSDSLNNHYKKIPHGIWPLFLAADIDVSDTVNDPMVLQEYIFKGGEGDNLKLQYLHMALPIIVKFAQADETIHWRKKLETDTLPVSGYELRKVLNSTIGSFTRYVFSITPSTLPPFLNDADLKKLIHD